MKLAIFFGVLCFVAEWANAQDGDQFHAAKGAEQILANMPVNVDHRCLGISLVAAALLEGEIAADDDCDMVEDLSKRIYEAEFTKARVRYHSALCLDGDRVAITSQAGLNALAIAVFERYKQRHLELIATADGIKKIRDAEQQFLRSRRAIAELLEADPDHIMPFALLGERRFPDGKITDSNHVVLLAKLADGEIIVYDPNDPGRPIPCRFQPASDGILITWTCGYKDPGIVTTQQYRIIELDRFFREALARD
ncbi:MAG TPA: hypothetical protein VGI40_03655 [Pirellulaceae bacterium]